MFRRAPKIDVPTREVRARDLREGMTMVAMPNGWSDVHQHPDDTWPKIVGQPEYMEHGEGDQPCMYWDVDLPERCHIPMSERTRGERWKLAWGVANECDRHFWATADLPITISAEGGQ